MLRYLPLLLLTACLGFGDDPAEIDTCGDAVVDRDEQCDDGNLSGGDGCSAICTLESLPDCGDGILDPGEQCDDGNTLGGDGCSAACAFETTSKRRTLRQSTTDVILANNAAACRDGTTFVTRQNAWFRRFVPADHGISTSIAIDEVSFGIEEATAGNGLTTQPATLRIYSYNAATVGDTLDTAQMTKLAELQLAMTNTSMAFVTRPIAASIPAGRAFVVELFVPEGNTTGHKFRIGTNQDGEQRVGYFAAPACNVMIPTNIPAIAPSRPIHLVMNVTGTID